MDTHVGARSCDSSRRNGAVLVVDADEWTRQTLSLNLRRLGICVCEADTGAAAITQAQFRPIDLAVLDLRLPDISALQIVASLKDNAIDIPWIVYSDSMTVGVAVEAIKCGASNAVELPFDVEAVVMPALRDAQKRYAPWPSLPLTPRLRPPKSIAERWACLVLRGCDSDHDLRTLRDWARFVATSCSGLAETCRMTGVEAHRARDFTRVLRVLVHTHGRVENIEAELDISDERTARSILQCAGLSAALHREQSLTFSHFLASQRFVHPNGCGARTITAMIQDLSVTLLSANQSTGDNIGPAKL
jgi:ActR/RegA family two-component response regulator